MKKSTSLKATSSAPQILLAFDWSDERTYRGIVKFASEAGWHLSPYMFSDRMIPFNWPGDGALTSCGPRMKKFIASLRMPVVDLTRLPLPHPVPRVAPNDERIGELAAEHFLSRGYHHFAFYSWPIVPVNRLREAAFFQHLRARGVTDDFLHRIVQAPSHMLTDWNLQARAIADQLKRLPRPLAVFTGQDNLGAALIQICAQFGIHVPEEVSILGVDNIEFLCDSLVTPLSSIDTSQEKIGYTAARQLDRLMKGEITSRAPPLLMEPGGLITRMSTDVLAIPHPAVVKALRFITESFGKPIVLEDIADYIGMSKRGMERAFLKHLNRSPADELRRLRLDHAKKLLTETDLKIDAIAQACGYSNSSNLSFAFNRDTHMSPRAYRKTHRAESERPRVSS